MALNQQETQRVGSAMDMLVRAITAPNRKASLANLAKNQLIVGNLLNQRLSSAAKSIPYTSKENGQINGKTLTTISASIPEEIDNLFKNHPKLFMHAKSVHIRRAIELYFAAMGVEE